MVGGEGCVGWRVERGVEGGGWRGVCRVVGGEGCVGWWVERGV